ncbi:uncharacterized protein TNCV_3963231 [Trichonephila clavipes]|nr:uncharacterized protein TNCV_3963231 [Trichonephila clavipes]
MAPTKGKKRLEDNYYEFSVLEEFVEYENFTNSKDLADLALEKIESYLTSINRKLQFEENKSKVNAYSNINLPKYDLPQFAGDFNSWLSFKSIFSSSIDSNESLTDIQKLQYLQNPVTSDASRLIKGFAITHENYKQAWETLLNRYDNQRELAFSQCKRLFSLRNVKPTSESIRAMIDVCNEVLRNFKTLGLECNQLVELLSLLVFSLQDKLEDSIKVKWELTLEDKNFPSLNKFLSFLEKQASSLQVSKFDWAHINGLQLADPTFYISRPVDMILGADVYFDLILYGKYLGLKNQTSALNSKLGWLLSGKSFHSLSDRKKKVMSLINCHALLNLQNQIAKFWEVESIPDASNLSEDQRVEKNSTSITQGENRDGRYVVSLPFSKTTMHWVILKCKPRDYSSRWRSAFRLIQS